MTREGVVKPGKRWYPELVYIFSTAVIVDIQGQILFTKAKDREEWITGAGGELIIPKDTSKPIFLHDTAIRETTEELRVKGKRKGLEILIMGPGPFHCELQPGDCPYLDKSCMIQDPTHLFFAYYLARLKNETDRDKIAGRKQPSEPDCETEQCKWMSREEFLTRVENGEMKTYPNIHRVLDSLNRILEDPLLSNPFARVITDFFRK